MKEGLRGTGVSSARRRPPPRLRGDPGNLGVFAQGSDAINVGVIGCGGRGTGATVELPDGRSRVAGCRARRPRPRPGRELLKTLKEKFRIGSTCRQPALHGFDNYLGVCSCPEVHLIVTAAPPASVPSPQGGDRRRKHVLHGEAGGRRPGRRALVIASRSWPHRSASRSSRGTQRPAPDALPRADEARARRADRRDLAAQCYWNMGDLWSGSATQHDRQEWQCRNWLYFSGVRGPHRRAAPSTTSMCELGDRSMPKNIMGMVAAGPPCSEYGNISTLLRGIRVRERACASPACADRPRGAPSASRSGSSARRASPSAAGEIRGEKPWTFTAKETNPYVLEHRGI